MADVKLTNIVSTNTIVDTKTIPENKTSDNNFTDLFEINNKSPNNVPINGKIDLDFRQSQTAGDCGLLGLILAMKEKKNGLDYLNSLLKYDDKNNTVSVNLKGVNKTYTFTKEEIEKNDNLSTGDGDVRAIEVAVAKYKLEKEKEGKGKLDLCEMLNGTSSFEIFHILKGDRPISKYPNLEAMIDDFGNQDKFFQLSFFEASDNPQSDVCMVKNYIALDTKHHVYEPIFANHSYAITNSDKDYIYLKNPHDSSMDLRVKREVIKNANGIVECNCFK